MKTIFKISIICAQGADWFMVGQRNIYTIKEEAKQVHEEARAMFYVCRDKEGGLVAEISASAPIIVEWE